MRNPIHVPLAGTLRRSRPGFVAGADRALAQASGRRQALLKDRFCAVGVIGLALLTAVMCGALAVTELAPYRAAAAPAGNPALLSAPQGNSAPVGATSGLAWRHTPERPGDPREIDANALTILATVINLLIFVALGLYLKWDAGRKR